MPDPHIDDLSEIQIGDIVTSHPRRDFEVRTMEFDDWGDLIINKGTDDQARILRDQSVTIMPRYMAALRSKITESKHSHWCGNCEGIDPAACLMNPVRSATGPLSDGADRSHRPDRA